MIDPDRWPSGVVRFEAVEHRDERGSFRETFVCTKFRLLTGIEPVFAQDNISRSDRHVLRGLHLQVRAPQGKLVTCIQGAIFDVGVDLRTGSPTFRHWVATQLDASNCASMWWPPGFAHGFLALSDDALVAYKVTTLRDASSELVIAWNDPTLAIDWPIDGTPSLSDRDLNAPLLTDVLTQMKTFG